MHAPPSAAANFHAKHGVPIGDLNLRESRPHVDWQLVSSEFQILYSQHSIGGLVDMDMLTNVKPRHLGNSNCSSYHSIDDDTFAYPWIDNIFCDVSRGQL